MYMHAERQTQLSRHTVALGSPIIIEGLRSLGCDLAASTGFSEQLPIIAARVGAATVLAHTDGRDPHGLLRSLREVRAVLPGARLVVLLPKARAEQAVAALSALSCEVVADDVDTVALQLLLGIGFAAPSLLTRREIDVLTLAGEGLSNVQIGRRLGLQVNTVKNYMRSVHRKFGATSRTEAVMIAARAGYPVIKLR